MDDKIKNARKQYAAEYRARNRDRIRDYQRNWRKLNPDKVKATRERFWNKKAHEYESNGSGDTT